MWANQNRVLLLLTLDLIRGEKVLTFVHLRVGIVDVDSGENFVESVSALGINDHLVGIKIEVDFIIILPDLRSQSEEFVQVLDVCAL